MIEVIVLSSVIAFTIPQSNDYDYIQGSSISYHDCNAYQEIVESTHTEAGSKCNDLWNNYYALENARCSGDSCHAVYIIPPDCKPEKVVLSRKLVGLCDDCAVRWKETLNRHAGNKKGKAGKEARP